MKIFINALIDNEKTNLVVENGKFIYIGQNYHDFSGEIIDLQNGHVFPAFNDSHMHLYNLGQIQNQGKLFLHTKSRQEMFAYLKKYTKNSTEKLIISRGFNNDLFTDDKSLPTRKELDEISDKALVCIRACGHVAVVNSKAIELLKLKNTNLTGCKINTTTGVIEENALDKIYDNMPLRSISELKHNLLTAMKICNSYGITTVQTDDFLNTNNSYDDIMQAYMELIKEKRNTCRVVQQTHFRNLASYKDFLKKSYLLDSSLKIGPLKLIADGSLGARTAYVSRNYKGTNYHGMLAHKIDYLDQFLKVAKENNQEVITHCIGDKALDIMLDLYKKNGNLNPGIVHLQISRYDQIAKLKELNTKVFMQGIFLDYDASIVYDLVPELAESSYIYKTLLNHGLRLSNGSDAPVEMPNCLKNMELLRTRTSTITKKVYLPKEKYTIKDCFDSFTIKAASNGNLQNLGKIAIGHAADFIILEDNPYLTNNFNTKVLETYFMGNKVYDIKNKMKEA